MFPGAEFADQQAVAGHPVQQSAVAARIGTIQTSRHHRDGGSVDGEGALMGCGGGTAQQGWSAVNLMMLPFLTLAGGALIWMALRPRDTR